LIGWISIYKSKSFFFLKIFVFIALGMLSTTDWSKMDEIRLDFHENTRHLIIERGALFHVVALQNDSILSMFLYIFKHFCSMNVRRTNVVFHVSIMSRKYLTFKVYETILNILSSSWKTFPFFLMIKGYGWNNSYRLISRVSVERHYGSDGA